MEVPEKLIEALANYLSLKPYREVAGLLAEIQQAAINQQTAIKQSQALKGRKNADAAHDAVELPKDTE